MTWQIKLLTFLFLSAEFKDLVSKMLNPLREHRLTIKQVEDHEWISSAFVEGFAPIDDAWKNEKLQSYAEDNEITVDEVTKQLSQSPYGKLGGVYNIHKLMHQMEKLKPKKVPIANKTRRLKVINRHRPDQSITN